MTAVPIEMGRQIFDGLGRQLSVSVTGRTTHYHYRPGQLPPVANTLPDGKRVAFTYEPHLGNALLAIQVDGEPNEQLAYHAQLCRPIQAIGLRDEQHWYFSPSGQLTRDTWMVDGQAYATHWRHSLLGRRLGFTDTADVEHHRTYDTFGRVCRVRTGDICTTFCYDAFSRPSIISTEDLASGKTLDKQLDYDSFGREVRCTFTVSDAGQRYTFVQTQAYSNHDQLLSRTWEAPGRQAQERFAYDLRGRLVHYTANADAAPQDPFGNAIVEQRFAFNPFDGLREVVSRFADGSADTATFRYADTDPTQVVSINHTHTSWPARIELTYDACGRVVSDSLGRRLDWNSHDRLTNVTYQGSTCHYHYSPSGQLCERVVDDELIRSFHSGAQLTHEQRQHERLELVGDGTSLFALSRIIHGIRQTTLLGCDAQGSVRLEAGSSLGSRHFSPHGAESERTGQTPFGFCGERREPLTGWIIPGGYRPYDPLLMCFLAPDSESPFGRGDINPYAWCGGDPVNRMDPDGHSWQTWVLTGVGLALGAAATAASFGSAAPALAALLAGGLGALSANSALAISSATLGALSLGSGAAATVLQATQADERASSVLGWLSLGTALAGAVVGMLPRIARLATDLYNTPGRAASKLSQFKPYHVGPGGGARPASVLFGSGQGSEDVAFVPNLFGEGNAALVTHGHPLGMLMNAQGLADDAVNIARELIAPRLAQMNYPSGQKFVLLACWGGKSGAAQKIANELGRPVEAYGEKLLLKNLAALQSGRSSGLQLKGNNQPLYKSSPWQRLTSKDDLADSSKYRIAKPKLYTPQ